MEVLKQIAKPMLALISITLPVTFSVTALAATTRFSVSGYGTEFKLSNAKENCRKAAEDSEKDIQKVCSAVGGTLADLKYTLRFNGYACVVETNAVCNADLN